MTQMQSPIKHCPGKAPRQGLQIAQLMTHNPFLVGCFCLLRMCSVLCVAAWEVPKPCTTIMPEQVRSA